MCESLDSHFKLLPPRCIKTAHQNWKNRQVVVKLSTFQNKHNLFKNVKRNISALALFTCWLYQKMVLWSVVTLWCFMSLFLSEYVFGFLFWLCWKSCSDKTFFMCGLVLLINLYWKYYIVVINYIVLHHPATTNYWISRVLVFQGMQVA